MYLYGDFGLLANPPLLISFALNRTNISRPLFNDLNQCGLCVRHLINCVAFDYSFRRYHCFPLKQCGSLSFLIFNTVKYGGHHRGAASSKIFVVRNDGCSTDFHFLGSRFCASVCGSGRRDVSHLIFSNECLYCFQ